MKKLKNFLAALSIAFAATFFFASCSQEKIEPDITSVESAVDDKTDNHPQTPCTDCDPD